MKHFLISFAAFFISFISFAQEDTTSLTDIIIDSTEIVTVVDADVNEIFTDTVLYTNFNTNLDNMVNLWYIQKSECWNYINRPLLNFDSSIVPQVTPEEYKLRISRMNSIIPLSYNDQVQGFINLYAFRKRDKVEVMMGLAEYYFPIFEEILEKNNVPQELKYLSIIESALNPRATLPVGAGGLWQFMPATGRMYTLFINSYIDDRRDPIKATYAAAKYLGSLHSMFDDWLLAIAAYNCGPGNVRKAINRSGGKRNFWEIYPYLPKETRGYVPAYIAAYYVFEYHAEHNLYARNVNYPPAIDTIMIKEQLHLQQVSEVLNIPLELLQDINPQYRVGIIPYSEKGNALYLPIEYISPFLTFQDSIFAYKDSIFFNPTIIARGPSSQSNNRSSKYASSSGNSSVYYYVKKGDNLSLIADWYNVRLQDLKTWNKLKNNSIAVGQKLIVFVPVSQRDEYMQITRMSFAQKQNLRGNAPVIKDAQPTKNSNTTVHNSNTKKSYMYHTVKSGDTLWAISQKYNNVSLDDIKRLNGLTNSSKITPGMKLKIKTM